MQDFHFYSACPWPQLRSKCILQRLQSNVKPYAHLSDILIEKCTITAGHIALLLKKNVKNGSNARSFMDVKADRATPTRVLFVLDAVPPSHSAASSNPRSNNKPFSLDTNPNTSNLSVESEEIRIIEGLFQVSKANKDGATIVKPPFLAARFDFRVIDIQFIKFHPTLESANIRSYASSHSNLRCVAAREDGVAYLWEWKADLFQWKYLNRFCYLSNPNLSWTKPVISFTAISISQERCESYGSDSAIKSSQEKRDMMEMAWWSTESNKDPELWFRKVIFEQEASTFRTEIILGNALSGSPQTILAMITSPLGIWIVSKLTQSIRILSRSSRVFKTMHLDLDCDQNPKWLGCCLHFTGQLLVLFSKRNNSNWTHSIYRIHYAEDHNSLEMHFISILDNDKSLEDEKIQLASHRQLLLILEDRHCHIYSLNTGLKLQSIQLPKTRIESDFAFWITSGASSAIGIWNECGVWWLQTPDPRKLLTLSKAQNAAHKISSTLSHGPSMKMDFIDAALDVLRSDPNALVRTCKLSACNLMRYIGNPALLLASSQSRVSSNVVDQVLALVTFIFQTIRSISKKTKIENSKASNSSMLLHLTPSNIESLEHMCSWLLLVKRQAQLCSLEKDVDFGCITESECTKRQANKQTVDLGSTMRSSFALSAQSMLHVAAFCLSIENENRDALCASKAVCIPRLESETSSSLRRLSLSDNLAFELFSRVYLHQNPSGTAKFLCKATTIHSSHRSKARTEAERVLLILPPKERYIGQLQAARRKSTGHKESKRSIENTKTLKHAEDCIHAYTDLLVQSGNEVEACQLLLECDLHETCLEMFLKLQKHAANGTSPALQFTYFGLLRHCIQERGGKELSKLLSLKPESISVTRVLHTLLSSVPPDTLKKKTEPQISLESIRPTLRKLLIESMHYRAKETAER
ncbi:hypothetical protein ABG067_003261 [Albugo candida]